VGREEDILRLESLYWKKGFSTIAGVDEAGRGPLAGPVVCAVVVFEKNVVPFVNKDSKKLTPSRRKKLFFEIIEKAKDFSFGIADSKEIDELNIYQAVLLCVKRAFERLKTRPDFVIADYLNLSFLNVPYISIKKGDENSFSCACASILAKVARDHIMECLHDFFPEYNFKKHKGYPTKEHISAINKYGICEIHRESFKHVKGERKRRRKTCFSLSVEERLQYYHEKLQEFIRGN